MALTALHINGVVVDVLGDASGGLVPKRLEMQSLEIGRTQQRNEAINLKGK